jgi:hypothetical protein
MRQDWGRMAGMNYSNCASRPYPRREIRRKAKKPSKAAERVPVRHGLMLDAQGRLIFALRPKPALLAA